MAVRARPEDGTVAVFFGNFSRTGPWKNIIDFRPCSRGTTRAHGPAVVAPTVPKMDENVASLGKFDANAKKNDVDGGSDEGDVLLDFTQLQYLLLSRINRATPTVPNTATGIVPIHFLDFFSFRE